MITSGDIRHVWLIWWRSVDRTIKTRYNGSYMKKNQIVTIAIIAIVGLLGIFLLMNRSKSLPTGQTPTQNNGGIETSTKDSIANLLTRTGSVQCTYSFTPPDGTASSGNVYVSGGKMHGEFKSTVAGKESTISMINDGSYSYTWGTDMPEGIKIKNPEVKADQPVTNESTKYVDPNQQYDFKCSPWNADSGKFTPPSTVTFRDFSAMMQGVQNKAGTTKDSQCAACASLTGDPLAQCKKALGCN